MQAPRKMLQEICEMSNCLRCRSSEKKDLVSCLTDAECIGDICQQCIMDGNLSGVNWIDSDFVKKLLNKLRIMEMRERQNL